MGPSIALRWLKQQNPVFSNFNLETMRASQHPEVGFLTPRSVKTLLESRFCLKYKISNIRDFEFYHHDFSILPCMFFAVIHGKYMGNSAKWSIYQSLEYWDADGPIQKTTSETKVGS